MLIAALVCAAPINAWNEYRVCRSARDRSNVDQVARFGQSQIAGRTLVESVDKPVFDVCLLASLAAGTLPYVYYCHLRTGRQSRRCIEHNDLGGRRCPAMRFF